MQNYTKSQTRLAFVQYIFQNEFFNADSSEGIEDFQKHLNIPIINGLSPSSHPTQVLSDIFTVEEIKKKPISKLKICWIGDSNNVLDSLIAASVKFSFRLSIGCPKKFAPGKKVKDWVEKIRKKFLSITTQKKQLWMQM